MLTRTIRTLALAGILAGLAGSWHSARAAADVSSLTTFSLRAQATGVSVLYEIKGLLPVDRFVEGASIFSESHVGPSSSTSIAASPYPGGDVLAVPGTVDGAAGTDLPEYPLAARAESPVTPHADESAGPVVLVADAEPGRSSSTAATAGDAESGVRATTKSEAGDGLLARGSSSSHDLVFGDGALTIGSVSSTVEVIYRDGKAEVTENRTVISDAEILGTPVVIGDGGVVVADQRVDLSGVEPAASALEGAGLDVRIVEPRVERHDTGMSVRSGSLVIDMPGEVQGRPSTFRIIHGGVRVDLDARPGALGDVLPPAAPVTRPSVAPTVTRPSVAPTGSTAAGPTTSTVSSSPASAAADASNGGDSASTVPIAAAFAEPIDFRPVYPWMAAIGLAAVVLQRWAAKPVRGKSATSDLRALWRW